MSTANVTEFVLLSFPIFQKFSGVFFMVLLLMYVLTIMVNVVIIVIVCLDEHLHTPMYVFLMNLSLLGICYTSVTVPKMMTNIISGRRNISVTGCLTQNYFHFLLGVTEFYLLAAMSFDHYVAICKPLPYTMIMSPRVSAKLALCSWACGSLSILVQAVFVDRLTFCGATINHFYCDVIPLLKLACADTRALQSFVFTMAGVVVLGSFLFSFLTYVCIVLTVMRIPSSEGRWKTFSTCGSHLMVVVILYGAVAFTYTRPQTLSSMDLNKLVAVLNLLITPVLNPFIYTLRNKQVLNSLRRLMRRKGKGN